MSTPVGIDLGTTFSCAAVWREGRVEVIPNKAGNNLTPSVVAYTDEEEVLVGESADNQRVINAANTVYNAKRIIGKKYEEAEQVARNLPFRLVKNEDGSAVIKVLHRGQGKKVKPDDVSAAVLQHLMESAETFLGKKVKEAVISVPAYFTYGQRRATIEAANLAGFKVLRLLNEPNAAAMAYGMHNADMAGKRILVFDMGGGTLDVSILSHDGNKLKVEGMGGDGQLGGEDFTDALVEFCVADLKNRFGKDIGSRNRFFVSDKSRKSFARLRQACEKAKNGLSAAVKQTITVYSLLGEDEDYSLSVTRSKFEEICKDLFKKCLEPVKEALSNAGVDEIDIDSIVLVGGASRMPRIGELMSQFFCGRKICKSVHPDEAIAQGAAIQAAQEAGVSTASPVLQDVTPLSLGYEILGQFMCTAIPRGTPVPARNVRTVRTASHNQDTVEIKVFEGERVLTRHNHLLGVFEMSGLPRAKAGEVEIELTLEMDKSNLLTVQAKEKSSGKREQLTIHQYTGHLTADMVREQLKDAEENKKEDEKHKVMEGLAHFMHALHLGMIDKCGSEDNVD